MFENMSASRPKIGQGSRVVLHYSITLTDGRVIDSTFGLSPVAIQIGHGEWLAAIERRLHGLCEGDVRTFEIPGVETALSDVPQVHTLNRDDFPADLEVVPDTVIGFNLPDGTEIAGTVVRLEKDGVVVDFGAPLCGRDFTLDVNIVKVDGVTHARPSISS